jgi:outer membrane receptor protein involved in Fe transport
LPAIAGAQDRPPDTTKTKRPSRLEDIVVTAAAARHDTPAGELTIRPLAIRYAPALNPYDLLRQVAGFEVHDQGQGPGFASDASIRGFSSDHSTDIALWIDGVPINEPVNGHAEGYNDWNLIFPRAIRSIEVFKGPTNPVYGNFALAGVVSVRTLERMQGTQGWASGGAFGRFEGTLLTGFDHPGAGGVFGVRAVTDNGWRPNSSNQVGQGHARVVKDLSPNATLDAGVELYAAGWDSPGFLTLDQFDQHQYSVVSNTTDGGFKHRAQERVSVRVIGGSSWLWRSTLYATQGRWQLFLTTPPEGGATEGSGAQLEEEDRRYGFGATSAVTWSAPKVSITLGAESRWDHSDYENWFTTNRRRDSSQILVGARQASAGLFLGSAVDVAPWLKLTAGGRYDVRGTQSTPEGGVAASDTRGVFSPKLGALVRAGGPIVLYANASRGFRQTDGVITDPTLAFITAWAYETGVRWEGARVTASAAVFRMNVSNEQTFDPLTAQTTSGGSSRRQGVELDLQAALSSRVAITGDWTFNDAKYRTLVTEDGDTLSGARVFNTAKFLGAVALDLGSPADRWHLLASTNVVGPYTPFDEPGELLPTYALFHLSGSYRIGRVALQLGIRNLFDRNYAELRAGGFVVPGQPRTVQGGVQYVF